MLGLGGQAWSDRHQAISHGEHETHPLMDLIKSSPFGLLEHFQAGKDNYFEDNSDNEYSC